MRLSLLLVTIFLNVTAAAAGSGAQATYRAVLSDTQGFTDFLQQPSASGTAVVSSVSGRVTDSSGAPVEGARVRPGRLWYRQERPVFVDQPVPSGWAVTDASGHYRLESVPPGEVYILVSVPRADPGDGTRFRLGGAFHPGVAMLDEATPIRVNPGAHHPGVDVVVPRVELHQVVVELGAAASASDVRVVLVASSGDVVRNLPWVPDGTPPTTGPRLPPGRYLVWARARAADRSRAAWLGVDLQGDVQLRLELVPTGRIHGRVIVERGASRDVTVAPHRVKNLSQSAGSFLGGGAPPGATQVVADLLLDGRAVDPLAPDRTDVGPDGRFALEELFGPRRLRVLGLPEGWQVIAVRQGRSDRTESRIDVAPGQTVSDVEIVVGQR
jgi:hypothetical protein